MIGLIGAIWAIALLAAGLPAILGLEGSPALELAKWSAIILAVYLAWRLLAGVARR